jgi:hypothetical protein
MKSLKTKKGQRIGEVKRREKNGKSKHETFFLDNGQFDKH